jgi:hypothetical protein
MTMEALAISKQIKCNVKILKKMLKSAVNLLLPNTLEITVCFLG